MFTTQFLHVMGGVDSERYLYFVEVCGHAYNIVRRHGHLFLSLFTLMLATGIPELQKLEVCPCTARGVSAPRHRCIPHPSRLLKSAAAVTATVFLLNVTIG